MTSHIAQSAKKLFLRWKNRKPPIAAIAEAVTISPTRDQLALKQYAEPALLNVCDHITALEEVANQLTRLGVPLNIDSELRSILGKAYKARKRTAVAVYVRTNLEPLRLTVRA